MRPPARDTQSITRPLFFFVFLYTTQIELILSGVSPIPPLILLDFKVWCLYITDLS